MRHFGDANSSSRYHLTEALKADVKTSGMGFVSSRIWRPFPRLEAQRPMPKDVGVAGHLPAHTMPVAPRVDDVSHLGDFEQDELRTGVYGLVWQL